MSFSEKIIWCYKYLFYTQYTCFNCGLDFRTQKLHGDDNINFTPACSYSCLMSLCDEIKSIEIREFRTKYDSEWQKEYIKYIKISINRPRHYEEKIQKRVPNN